MKDYVPLIETGLWVIFATMALIVFMKPVKERIESGASFEAGPAGIKFGELERKVDALGDAVSRLFLHTMSGQMYENLKKLTSGNFGNYVMGSALERELRHLRDIGYIRVHSISSVPPEGENLSQYVSVTEAGSQFVALREKAAAERNKKPENTQTSY